MIPKSSTCMFTRYSTAFHIEEEDWYDGKSYQWS
jgi:hypothetical protein